MKETTMNLTKAEQQYIAENITRYDVVTNLTVDNIEIRIHGKAHGGTGSTALYRTANIADIYAHGVEKRKEAIADSLRDTLTAKVAKIKKFGSWDKYLKSEADKLFDSDGWMLNSEAGKE